MRTSATPRLRAVAPVRSLRGQHNLAIACGSVVRRQNNAMAGPVCMTVQLLQPAQRHSQRSNSAICKDAGRRRSYAGRHCACRMGMPAWRRNNWVSGCSTSQGNLPHRARGSFRSGIRKSLINLQRRKSFSGSIGCLGRTRCALSDL